ncbi:Ctr copper transporter [Biscogniauxia marginata]|nr:Ctr copper transporter [Biscogniauxia marginata]
MLWNWNTIDSCFLSSSWHITSPGMFGGSCIGVILLTMALEFMRRTVKEYDRYLIRKHTAAISIAGNSPLIGSQMPTKANAPTSPASTTFKQAVNPIEGLKPSLLEQAVRAFLHTVQFAIAYLVMLLAMYFNGYIIICIFIGAYLGAFVFHWETLDGSRSPSVCCA